ncbi:MAG TPA: SDR family NAD(P)-dependent oxidoreductase [Pseudomonadales bacterium]
MKSVWITGASSGIGRALAMRLADLGWSVLATARNEDALLQLEQYSSNIQALPADLTVAQDIDTLRTFFDLRGQGLDALVVNAGSCEYMDNATLDSASLRRVFELNVFAAAETIDVALPWLKKAAGHVLGIISMSVYLPFTRAEYYGASKAAFRYYLQSLRVDLAASGVSVTEVYPGFIDTPLTEKNDFPMPLLMPVDKAVQRLVAALDSRPLRSAFPWRLHVLLKLMAVLSPLWRVVHQAKPVS